MMLLASCSTVLLILLCASTSIFFTTLTHHHYNYFYSKLPVLKSFLKDGEAEFYEGVTVKFVHGRRAVLTVYDDETGMPVGEPIELQQHQDKNALHQVMRDAGFSLKSEQEMRTIRARKLEEQAHERFQKFKDMEYYRKRKFYVDAFREFITGEDAEMHRRSDFMLENYDAINRKEAVFKEELLQSARNFLSVV